MKRLGREEKRGWPRKSLWTVEPCGEGGEGVCECKWVGKQNADGAGGVWQRLADMSENHMFDTGVGYIEDKNYCCFRIPSHSSSAKGASIPRWRPGFESR